MEKPSQNLTVITIPSPSDTSSDVIDFSKHNSLRKFIRVMAFILQFNENSRKNKTGNQNS